MGIPGDMDRQWRKQQTPDERLQCLRCPTIQAGRLIMTVFWWTK